MELRIRSIATFVCHAVGLLLLPLLVGCRNSSETVPADVVPQAEHADADASSSTHNEVSTSVSLSDFPRELAASLAGVHQLSRKQDARLDSWDTEVLSELSSRQLDYLRLALEANATEDAWLETLRRIGSASLRIDSLVPSSGPPNRAETVLDDSVFVVRRARVSSDAKSHDAALGGIDPIVSFREFSDSLWTGASDGAVRAKFKVVGIQPESNSFTTSVRCEIYAKSHSTTASPLRQVTANWSCRWLMPTANEELPRLDRIWLVDWEEVNLNQSVELFLDRTGNVLAKNASYRSQVVPGIPDWLGKIPKEFMGQFGYHGLAIGDVNGDLRDDIYVCDAGGLPNRLYLQLPDGSARDVSHESGVDFLDDSVGALLVDLDNDGDQDLVVGVDPVLQFAENDGSGRFTLREGRRLNTDSFSLTSADYDQDGDLDIYVCGYNVRKKDPTDRGLPFPIPYHDATNGGRNYLLRNDGGFAFTDVTNQAGLGQGNNRFSMAAAWEDFDNDGDQDLYVANDFGRNNLYRNDHGVFTDIASSAAVEDHASGMSVAWGDYNRDGRMDLYVGNMFSAAGNRVTYQRRFADGVSDSTVKYLQRMARGNSLFRNATTADNAVFQDASELASVAMGRWAWGSKFVDLNNNGWLDLVVANGYLTNENKDDL